MIVCIGNYLAVINISSNMFCLKILKTYIKFYKLSQYWIALKRIWRADKNSVYIQFQPTHHNEENCTQCHIPSINQINSMIGNLPPPFEFDPNQKTLLRKQIFTSITCILTGTSAISVKKKIQQINGIKIFGFL